MMSAMSFFDPKCPKTACTKDKLKYLRLLMNYWLLLQVVCEFLPKITWRQFCGLLNCFFVISFIMHVQRSVSTLAKLLAQILERKVNYFIRKYKLMGSNKGAKIA